MHYLTESKLLFFSPDLSMLVQLLGWQFLAQWTSTRWFQCAGAAHLFSLRSIIVLGLLLIFLDIFPRLNFWKIFTILVLLQCWAQRMKWSVPYI